MSSNFSLNGSSAHHSNDGGSLFDLDVDMLDSGPSLQSDSSSTPRGQAHQREERESDTLTLFHVTACLDVLDPSLLTDRARSQQEAALFLIHWHAGNLDELAQRGRVVGAAVDEDCMVQNVSVWEALRGILAAKVSECTEVMLGRS